MGRWTRGFRAAALIDRDIDDDGARLHSRDSPCRGEFLRSTTGHQGGFDDHISGGPECFDKLCMCRNETNVRQRAATSDAVSCGCVR